MAFEKIVKIGDREVTVYELTVKEVRNMAKAAENKEDPLANWLIEDAPLNVLAAMSSVDEESFEDWRPSEIKRLAKVCEEVNPDFFDMNRRISELMQKLRAPNSTGQ